MPGAFSVRSRQQPDRIGCGISPLDEWLRGGLPVGSLTELVGAECSGRTSAALAYVAATMRLGNVCAWIDVADVLDPETVAANGVDLERMLWVRCGAEQEAASRGRNMPEAMASRMRPETLPEVRARREKKALGTPGAPNLPLSYRSGERVEQINSDRLPARRGDNLALFAPRSEPLPRRHAGEPAGERTAAKGDARQSLDSLDSLDKGLRVADLLLQGGGFGTLVLDMGSVPPDKAWRVPLATWFRFRAACERTRTSLFLLTQHSCARSSAELVVRLNPGSMNPGSMNPGSMEPGSMEPGNMAKRAAVMTGMLYSAHTERSRHAERIVDIRKPPQAHGRHAQGREAYGRHAQSKDAQWKCGATWAQGL